MVTKTNEEVAGDLTLRKATPQDFDAIRDIALRSRMAALSHFMTEDEVEDEVKLYYSDDVLNGILNNPNNVIYVVEKGSQMVGHGSVLLQDRRGKPRLLQFYVRPGYQRLGIGEMLFDSARTWLKNLGASEMYISTLGDNTVGRSFLTKHGCHLLQIVDKVWDGATHSVAFYYPYLFSK